MSRLAAASFAIAAAALPAAASAGPPHAEGVVETDRARIEILGHPVRVGQRVDLPEGWIRVEEKGTEDAEVGSFAIVSAEALDEDAATPPPERIARAEDPGPAAPARRDCRAERAAYLAQLWKLSGIEVSSPDAILDGLDAGRGASTGYYWFALGTDAFRPLAWSSDLRDRARALARCMQDR